MNSNSVHHSDLHVLKGKDLENYGFERVRDLAYEAVHELWRRRKSEGWTQARLAEKLCRDTGWLSKNLQGPGNWTFRTFGALIQGLDGELEIKVHAAEDPVLSRENYHAYAEYNPETLCDDFRDIENVSFRTAIGPVLNRYSMIEDEAQQLEDTSRREDDENERSNLNKVHVKILDRVDG